MAWLGLLGFEDSRNLADVAKPLSDLAFHQIFGCDQG
jgi:hypothetical protein